MDTFTAERRVTHKYAAGYSNLDRYAPIPGAFGVLKSGPVLWDDGGDTAEQRVTLKAPRGATQKDVTDAALYAFSRHCRCAHDCCGHVNWSVWTHRTRHNKRREWTVVLFGVRNV